MAILWQYLKHQRRVLAAALALATINQVFSLLDPQIFRLIIDRYASRANTLPGAVFLRGVALLLGASVAVAFVSRVAKNFQDYFVSLITQRVGTALYAASVQHSFGLPYAVFEDQRSGELLQKLQKARTDAQNVIASSINVIFLSLIGVVFVLTYATFVHWMVGLSYALMIPVLGGVSFVVSRRIKQAQQLIVRESADLAGATTETLRNVELVKSLGLEAQEVKRLNAVNERLLGLELGKIKLIRALSFTQGTLINAVRSLMLLLMLWLIFRGAMTLGEFFSLMIYSFFIFNPLYELSTVAAQFQEARASLGILGQVLETPPAPKPAAPRALETLRQVTLADVGFTYANGSRPALSGVNLTMRGGETVALVGPSGCGKTTLVKLLVGLYPPSQGAVRFNGVDARQLDFDQLRRRIGLVAQETQLFAGTIRENLLFAQPEASDDECLAVLDLAAAASLLERGGRGLDTKIGEGGLKLSGGERQRLAIARALLRQPELLIFDEATSSLDSITERAITETVQAIERARPNLMTVLVAHRLSTVRHAQRIYVLERGRVVEQGRHDDLLASGGLYAALWREQRGSE